MALTFEDVEDWTRRTRTVENPQRELSQRTTTLAGLQDQLADIRRLEGWAHAVRTQVGFNTVAVVAGLPELAVRK